MPYGISARRKEMGEEAWSIYQNIRKNRKANAYRQRNIDKVVNWRIRTKRRLISELGGKCQICGYNKDIPGVYCFHHINSIDKSFGIGGKCKSYQTLLKEAKKCNLLCSNCHAELHDKEHTNNRNEQILRTTHQGDEIGLLNRHKAGSIPASAAGDVGERIIPGVC